LPHAPALVTDAGAQMVKAHYRFCNEFLWPLMHELPKFCVFRPDDFEQYRRLQSSVSKQLLNRREHLFIHDYQFALLPSLVSASSSLFWHIPWPATVDEIWQPLVSDLAIRMLSAEQIGFQTEEYAENYLRSIEPSARRLAETKVFAAPISIDDEMWECRLSESTVPLPTEIAQLECPFVLSIDRADYAKGINERLGAIDVYFERNPDQAGKISFVQICARSRTGIAAYDRYWEQCRSKERAINARWCNAQWQPIVWLESSFSPDQLSKIYLKAEALLITSLKDGLNLTAKEFVACQMTEPGILLLSKETGAFSELGGFAIGLDPQSTMSIVKAIESGLSMPTAEKLRRIDAMKVIIRQNSLISWSSKFSPPQNNGPADVIPLYQTRKEKTY